MSYHNNSLPPQYSAPPPPPSVAGTPWKQNNSFPQNTQPHNATQNWNANPALYYSQESPLNQALRPLLGQTNPSNFNQQSQPTTVNGYQEYATPQPYPAYDWSGGYEQYGQSAVAPNNYGQTQNSQQLYCEPCDKSFHKDFQYQKHLKSHQTCTECGFSACKPVLSTHKEVIHGIKKANNKGDMAYKPLAISLDTPEEIAKWIEQRKKKYPTDSNIRQKELEESNKRERGEPVDNKKKRNPKSDKESRKKIKTEDTEQKSTEQSNDPLNLIAGYGNSSDGESSNEDMDPEKDAITSKTPTTTNSKSTRKCKYFLRGKCRHGDKCKFQHVKQESKKSTQDKKADKFRQRPGLLKMLLSSEIERERSYILQALRYIVQQDFFTAKSSESDEDSSTDTDSLEE